MDPYPLANIFERSNYDEPVASDLSALDYRYEVLLEIRESENCDEVLKEEIYEMILDTSPATQIDVEELEKSLTVDDNNDNTFYCDFDVFKNIYQINVRSARRSMKARILTLLTIVDTSGCLDEKAIRQEADILREVISNSLRKNDVYSKFNMTQYSLILASPDLDGAKIAVDRITNRYNEKKKHDEIILTNDLKKIR